MNKKQLLDIIEDEEYNHDFGGEEDEEGTLHKGNVDFDRIREAIDKFALSEQTAVKKDE